MTLYYQDDLITLYHGDCREETGWVLADVLVTDPPYGVAMRSSTMGGTKPDQIAGDDDVAARDQAVALWQSADVNKKGPLRSRPAIIFGSWRMPRPAGDIRQMLIWHKGAAKPGWRTAAWYPAHEEIYVLGDGWVGTPEGTVYRTTTPQDGASGLVATTGHPTPKPVGLMERLIAHAPDGRIADPFAGSGSTLIAARNLGRSAVGVELEERHCEGIARRLSQQAFDFGALEAEEKMLETFEQEDSA